jgi:hypothetical protein
MSIKNLEADLRLKLKSYKSKSALIDEVIPNDLDDLLEIVKANPRQFPYVIKDIRQRIVIILEGRIGMR